ncbi:MAG TPA: FMN-binding protein [Candidatus Acidoferrales bacterium]|nr:FMN-binding protein [Candidatus Acidoferrales bacterium]
MKKILISVVTIVVFALYAVFGRNSSQASSTATGKPSSSNTYATNTSIAYKDGSYPGSAADAFYGTIQVRATVLNGKITDVQFLQYPNDSSHSVEVNQSAMPVLKQEAIQAQSANVDIVSGATQTSQAFKESLAAALSQAK